MYIFIFYILYFYLKTQFQFFSAHFFSEDKWFRQLYGKSLILRSFSLSQTECDAGELPALWSSFLRNSNNHRCDEIIQWYLRRDDFYNIRRKVWRFLLRRRLIPSIALVLLGLWRNIPFCSILGPFRPSFLSTPSTVLLHFISLDLRHYLDVTTENKALAPPFRGLRGFWLKVCRYYTMTQLETKFTRSCRRRIVGAQFISPWHLYRLSRKSSLNCAQLNFHLVVAASGATSSLKFGFQQFFFFFFLRSRNTRQIAEMAQFVGFQISSRGVCVQC